MQSKSDDDLMLAAGGGDAAAFGCIVARHLPRASALAARIVGSRSDAEEIVQEAFLRAWIKAPEWRRRADPAGGATFATWLYRVIVNLCLDRKRHPEPAGLDAAAHVADPAPDGFAAATQRQIAARVASAVANLPDRQRAALVLCHYEGLSNVEAAAILNVSVGALESLLVRARRQLRAALADLNVEDAGG